MYCGLGKFQKYNTTSSTVLFILRRKPFALCPYHSYSWHSVTGIQPVWICSAGVHVAFFLSASVFFHINEEKAYVAACRFFFCQTALCAFEFVY